MTHATMSADETRATYPDDITLREARARYFARSGFDDSTYSDRWVRLPVGPLTAYLPNLAPRREAVRVHDIDHIVTGYGTDWNGELRISAFELAMGLGRYWFGTFIDAGGVAMGVLRWPRDLVAAYARGRTAKQSVYRVFDRFSDADLDRTVGEVRALVGAADDAVPTAADTRAVLAWAAFGVATQLLLPLGLLAAAVALVVIAVR